MAPRRAIGKPPGSIIVEGTGKSTRLRRAAAGRVRAGPAIAGVGGVGYRPETVRESAPRARWRTKPCREASMHLRAKAVLMSGAAALALAVTAFAPALAQA